MTFSKRTHAHTHFPFLPFLILSLPRNTAPSSLLRAYHDHFTIISNCDSFSLALQLLSTFSLHPNTPKPTVTPFIPSSPSIDTHLTPSEVCTSLHGCAHTRTTLVAVVLYLNLDRWCRKPNVDIYNSHQPAVDVLWAFGESLEFQLSFLSLGDWTKSPSCRVKARLPYAQNP